jgi:DNA-binding GntR family transcriptional regulator
VRYHDFSDLDSRFHRLVNTASPNRFIDGFFDLITLIFHYHYQWNKRDERQRNEIAIREHLAYIDALFGQRPGAVDDMPQASRPPRTGAVHVPEPTPEARDGRRRCCCPRHGSRIAPTAFPPLAYGTLVS